MAGHPVQGQHTALGVAVITAPYVPVGFCAQLAALAAEGTVEVDAAGNASADIKAQKGHHIHDVKGKVIDVQGGAPFLLPVPRG